MAGLDIIDIIANDDIDDDDLYEGGRYQYKRKTGGFGDYDHDDDPKTTKFKYNPNETVKLIKTELKRRKSSVKSTDSDESIHRSLSSSYESESQITCIRDPFNRRIEGLNTKMRELTYKKIYEHFKQSNINTNNNDYEKYCVDIEHQVFQNSNNLISYQSRLIKKVNEIKMSIKNNNNSNTAISNNNNSSSSSSTSSSSSSSSNNNNEDIKQFESDKNNNIQQIENENYKDEREFCIFELGHHNNVELSNNSQQRNDVVRIRNPKQKHVNLHFISKLVIKQMNGYYRDKRFLTKELFKEMAKKLTHFILDKNYQNENEISNKIDEIIKLIFDNCALIKSNNDFNIISAF